MTAKIPTLSERLIADLTAEWPLSRVLAEVVTQVAALGEGCVAVLELAAEVELHALCGLIAHLDNFVPLGRYSLKLLRKLRWVGYLNHVLAISMVRNVTSIGVGPSLVQRGLSTLEVRANIR